MNNNFHVGWGSNYLIIIVFLEHQKDFNNLSPINNDLSR